MLNDWISILSAIVAVASFAFNWVVVRRQMSMQYEGLKAQMEGDMMKWAHEAVDLISTGAQLARGRGRIYASGELAPRLNEIAIRLSSVADRGRLFFPNTGETLHGLEKERAYQGFRPPVLDAVIFAHMQVDRIDPRATEPDTESAEFLVRCRRLFVSEAQSAIDPRRRLRMLAELAEGGAPERAFSAHQAADLAQALADRYPDIRFSPGRRVEAPVQDSFPDQSKGQAE